MIYKSKTLRTATKQMITTLMDLHEREMMGMEPVDAALCLSTAGLVRRDFVAAKIHSDAEGKEYMSVHITRKGKEFLSSL
jgi:hypothetical protein